MMTLMKLLSNMKVSKLWPYAPFFTGIKLGVIALKIVARLTRIILVASFSMNGNRKWNMLIL